MKKIVLIIFVLTGCLYVNHSAAQSQDDMKKWMDYMTPAKFHQMIAKWDGEWEEEITMWMAPGVPAEFMEASCENTMLLDGRYQESKHEGNFMGMPFKGISVTGFDNVRKVIVSTWIDNFGTGIMYMEGPWDEASRTMNLKGKMTDPLSGKMLEIRQVTKIVDDNTQVMEQFTTQDGKEFKSMEIKLTRKK